jgi:hypothetical protein
MSLARKVIGPKSKYNKSLPYTYMAKVAAIEGDEDLLSYYFADTICGLLEYLESHDLGPDGVDLYGLYLKKEIPLEKEYCLTHDGNWKRRPDICKSLEKRYKETLEERYKGHLEKEPCAFEDRDRTGRGTSPGK